MIEFQKFGKIQRLSRDCVITEKLDGTNGQIHITSYRTLADCGGSEITDTYIDYVASKAISIIENKEDKFNPSYIFAGSRKRWLDTSSNGDNYGFAKWVQANAEELLKLGEGHHYGEWWGKGIQRNYGLDEKRFSLFNVGRWCSTAEPKLISIDPKTKEERYQDKVPECCSVVPILYKGIFDTIMIQGTLDELRLFGSQASKGFMNAEGIIIYHTASGRLFKKTIKNDQKPKVI